MSLEAIRLDARPTRVLSERKEDPAVPANNIYSLNYFFLHYRHSLLS